ncbi:unnamed protein product [Prunus armeniaca]|uniref:Uncharacterized protein n=1 Tax=Prunus armeniaca TaxID=36596 RepID=A0A6J5UK65_PRUAR|nr:unnamed protein product [Prunus armeniaca]
MHYIMGFSAAAAAAAAASMAHQMLPPSHSAVLLCDQGLFYLNFSLAAATDEDGEVGCLNTSKHVLGKSTVQSLQCSLIQGWLAVVLDFKHGGLGDFGGRGRGGNGKGFVLIDVFAAKELIPSSFNAQICELWMLKSQVLLNLQTKESHCSTFVWLYFVEQEYVLAYIMRKQKLFTASAFVLQLESEADSSHTSEVYGGEGRGRIGLGIEL